MGSGIEVIPNILDTRQRRVYTHQILQQSVNLVLTLVIENDKLTDSWGNLLLPNGFMNTFCELRVGGRPSTSLTRASAASRAAVTCCGSYVNIWNRFQHSKFQSAFPAVPLRTCLGNPVYAAGAVVPLSTGVPRS